MRPKKWIKTLPALNESVIDKVFRRKVWDSDKGNYAFTDDGLFWKHMRDGKTYLLEHTHKLCGDWYEVEEEKISIDSFDFIISDIEAFNRKFNRVDTGKTHNKKENNMEKEIKENAAKVFTDIEKRSKYTGELYGPNGKGKAILSFKKKKDAKKVLQLAENLGCYIVLRKEVGVYTTAVPVVKAKV